jgi:formylglycine-generating enzyme required for sulfatase activity
VLLCAGAVVVLGILGYAAYEAFLGPADPPPETFTNSLGIKMVKLDGGTFRMGSPEAAPGHRPEEGPAHEVTVKGPFFMAATEVSHGQYLKLMGSSPAKSADRAHRPQHRPVEWVSWDDADEFCRKLSESEKGQKWARKGWAYRLPTEAEWEYAARAGTTTPFAFGDRLAFERQGLFRPAEDDPFGIGGGENPLLPQEVGRAEANRFGLHDMHGNVAEWCLDWYHPGYPAGAARDTPAAGDKRVVRGGSFRDPAAGARSASRAGVRPNEKRDDVGFRIVYAPVPKY